MEVTASGKPRMKRPRTGRPISDILGPIHADTAVTGPPKDVRHLLLYLGRPVRSEPLVDSLEAQSSELETLYDAHKDVVLDAILERFVQCQACWCARSAPDLPRLTRLPQLFALL